MDVRGFLYQKKEKKAKNIWIIVTTIIIIGFLVGIILLNKTDSSQTVDHFIGEKVSVDGVISYDDNYPTNTHKLVNASESFGLKDSKINLNNFLDVDVLIEGNISEISTKYPILNISTLKIPSYKLSVSDNKYFYTRELISFDFSKDIDVFSKKIGNQIIIYYKEEPLLYVDTFVCSNVTEVQNCEKMKSDYIINLDETFESTLGTQFFKNKENSWVVFNDNNIGYIFTVDSDDDLLNLSHFINIIDSKFLLSYKKDLLISGCSNEEIKMVNISGIEKGILDDNLIKVSVSGLDQNKNKVSCKLNIDVFDNRNIVNSTISFSE